MRKYLILFFFGCFIGGTLYPQSVSNVKVSQIGQKLHIQYELVTISPSHVELYISENNGGTWSKVTENLTGDVGLELVMGGKKEIVWDVLQSRESLLGNAIIFKVKVESGIKSVKIGNQVWMAENLNVDHFGNGDIIATGLSDREWITTAKPAYAIYGDETIYGKLYNKYAVTDPRGLCPAGYHVPSVIDWENLREYLGGEEEAAKKVSESLKWNVPKKIASNKSGFNAIPSGSRSTLYSTFGHSQYSGQGHNTSWWSTTDAWYLNFEHKGGGYFVSRFRSSSSSDSNYGLSVRCIQD
jgi:uncharacterized protein (TIGR02145 family)